MPVLVVATAKCRRLANGTAAEVDGWHVVEDGTDVSEFHVLLSDTFTATATSCRQLPLLRCIRHRYSHI